MDDTIPILIVAVSLGILLGSFMASTAITFCDNDPDPTLAMMKQTKEVILAQEKHMNCHYEYIFWWDRL